ncbi:hypothetical protein P154DRAFT_614925 [Amniculicola lignicola CBS 123094]|uniref:RNase III domain-containing protein n=1 Tax=Amniculicola lignicola CBS 123094 TaxID=1392246 RepID=A0A6A5X3V5_9PLEO|nr:hypothetical protein P154DRAFT_614925 [Amniculicola lignicola CBS 123094]
MASEYVQAKINYKFADVELLHSALRTAHRSDEEGTSDDGNRGLARLGLCAVDMMETLNAMVVENGTKRGEDIRDHWFRSKQGRAIACKRLGLDHYIIQSIRQQHEKPSSAILAHALSAVIGAVWLDLQRRNESTSNILEQISGILHRIHRIDTVITNAEGGCVSTTDESRTLILEGNHVIQGSIPGEAFNFTAPNEILGQNINLRAVPMHHSLDQTQNDTLFGTDPALVSFDSLQSQANLAPFGGALAHIQDMHFMEFHSDATGSMWNSTWLSGFNEAVEHQEQRIQIGHEGTADSPQGSLDTTEHPRTAVTLGKRKYLHDNEGRQDDTSLHQRLVHEELEKLNNFPTYIRGDLKALLDHAQIGELSGDASQVMQLRLLYFTIGSCQTLIGFKETLRVVRGMSNDFMYAPGPDLCCTERFREICRLDHQEALCVLLRRYHVVKLFETELANLRQSNGVVVETPSTFNMGHSAKSGNPAVRVQAELTDGVLGKIRPDLERGTREFRRIRLQISQLRRLAKVLQILSETYGFGILALLPSGPAYSEFNLTDNMQAIVHYRKEVQALFRSAISTSRACSAGA